MKRILLTVLMITFMTVAKAQVPQQLNYQGVARNASGAPITYQNITVRISVIDSAAGGQVVYRETRSVRTNYVGLFNILIGSAGATNVSGAMKDINWPTGKKHIKLEIDPNGLSNFSLAGITELQSVPYALSALPAGLAGGDLTGSYPYPQIADNAITNNKIKDGIISFSKLDQNLATILTSKLNISDTATMLSSYATKTQVSILSVSKLNVSDTANMLNSYYHSSTAEAQFAKADTNLNNEISRATDAEGVLKTGVASEVNRAVATEALKEDVANKSTDGTFASNSDTRYPSEKATKTYVDATALQNSAGLDSEVTRAITAEAGLTSKLSAESSDRTIADSTETLNRRGADNLLTSNLDTEVITRIAADSILAANLSTEITNSRNRDSLLNSVKEDVANKSTDITADGSSDIKYPTVKSVKDYVDAFSSGSNTGISAEIANRIAADSIESANRTDADTTITNNLNNEITRAYATEALLNTAKEEVANKSTDITADGSSDIKYPTVKSVKDYVDAFSTGSNTGISAEIANRIGGDSTEVANRTDADNLLTSNLDTEVITRTAADSTFGANLSTAITNSQNADALLNSAKEDVANKSTDIAADGSSDTKYPTVKSVKDYVDAFSSGSNTDISAEIASRIGGDSSLTSNLSAETENRVDADTMITNNLNNEVTRASVAETLLNAAKEDVANKSTDIAADGSSDTKYPTVKSVKNYVDAFSSGSNKDISAEIANRITGDSTLTSNMDTEVIALTSADSVETANRTDADTTITNNLNNEITRAYATEALLNTAKEDVANKSTDITADGSSDIKYPTVKSVKDYVDAFSSGSNTGISAEIANRIAGDSTEVANRTDVDNLLTSNLDTEVITRTAADSIFGANLSTAITNSQNADALLNSAKEDVANKSTDIATDGSSDTKYPTVKSVKDYVDAFSSGSNTDISAEVANRIAADSTLTLNLDKEIISRSSADSTLTSNLSAESSDRTTADSTETANRIGADTTITNNLNNEVTRATASEALLSAAKEEVANKSTDITADGSSDTKYPTVKSVKDYVDAFSSGSNTDISAEVASRITGDSMLTSNLSAESSHRTTADSTETANRTDTDNLLISKLEIEVITRTSADSTLTSDLSVESSNRTTTDSTETANRTDADTTITNNLNNEVTRATAAETLLNTAKEDVSNKSTDITADGSSDTKYPTVKSVKDYVDAFSSGSNTDISAEIAKRIIADSTETANRTDADNILTSNVSAETANRITADSTLVANLSAAADALNTAAQTALNTKVNISDTAAMLSPYAKEAATQTALATKVNIADTTAMLSPYAKEAATQTALDTKVNVTDTAAMLLPYSKNSTTQASLATKVNIADTTAMLSPYAKETATQTALDTKVNVTDTAAMLLPYSKNSTTQTALDSKVNISDTAAMLSPYAKETAIQTALGTKVNMADTTAMLLPYAKEAVIQAALNTKVNISDTAAMLSPFIKSSGTAAQILAANGSLITAGTNINISSGTISASLVREVADELSDTVAAQTSFTLTQIPSVNSKVKMYINGIRISNSAYTVSNNIITYIPGSNGNYALAVGDRIQFDYYY